MSDSPETVRRPRSRRRTVLQASAAIVFSASVLAFLLSRLELDRAWAAVRGADIWLIVFGGLVTAVITPVRGIRFRLLCDQASAGQATAAIGVQTAINRVAPMRLGELSLPFLLRRYAGANAGAVLLSLALVRIVEVTAIATLLVVAVAVRGGVSQGSDMVLLGAVVAVAVLVLFYFRSLMHVGLRFGRWLLGVVGVQDNRLLGKVLGSLEEAVLSSGRLSLGRRAGVASLTVLQLVLQVSAFVLILRAFGVELSWLASLQGACVAFAGMALPIPSVGMVGTLEAAWVAGFVWVGLDTETAILTAIAVQVLTLIYTFLIAAVCWLLLTSRSSAGQSQLPTTD